MITRRNFLGGLIAVAAAPAIVKAENIMRVKPLTQWRVVNEYGFMVADTLVQEFGYYEGVRFIESAVDYGRATRMAAFMNGVPVNGMTIYQPLAHITPKDRAIYRDYLMRSRPTFAHNNEPPPLFGGHEWATRSV